VINKLLFSPALAAAILVAGCSDPAFVGRPGLATVPGADLPPPQVEDLRAVPRPALIGPGDELRIDVLGLPDFSRSVRVDPSGRIAFPVAGTIEVANLTTSEVTRILEQRLRARYLRDPQVTVNVATAVSQTITVDGEVRAPGQFPVTGRTTLVRAIARASGTTEFARQNFVIVFRRVNNRDMAALYDLRAIRLGMYPDPEVYANDVIEVGEARARRVFKDLLQASGLLVAPLITVLQ
jgi:polysaccharide biosynthesis/export protein